MDLKSFCSFATNEAQREGVTDLLVFSWLVSAYYNASQEMATTSFDVYSLEGYNLTMEQYPFPARNKGWKNDQMYPQVYALWSEIPSLNTYNKRLLWFKRYRDLKPFVRFNSPVEWMVWNFINGTLDQPVAAPDTTLLNLGIPL